MNVGVFSANKLQFNTVLVSPNQNVLALCSDNHGDHVGTASPRNPGRTHWETCVINVQMKGQAIVDDWPLCNFTKPSSGNGA